jgi:hypothetical protein
LRGLWIGKWIWRKPQEQNSFWTKKYGMFRLMMQPFIGETERMGR